MSTETKTVELTQDELVAKLLATLKAKQAEVANAEKPTYVTGGQFRFTIANAQVHDITTTRTVSELTRMAGHVIEEERKYALGAVVTNDKSPFTWLGFTVEEWKKDLATRATVLQ